MTVKMTAPSPAPTQIVTRFLNTYTPDTFGNINAQNADVLDLLAAGFTVTPASGAVKVGTLTGANMNITTDQAFVMNIPASWPFRITKITAENASVSLTTAQGSIYTAISKGGTALTATPTTNSWAAMTTAVIALDVPLVAGATVATKVWAGGQGLWLSLTTAQGAPATMDLVAWGDVYTQ